MSISADHLTSSLLNPALPMSARPLERHTDNSSTTSEHRCGFARCMQDADRRASADSEREPAKEVKRAQTDAPEYRAPANTTAAEESDSHEGEAEPAVAQDPVADAATAAANSKAPDSAPSRTDAEALAIDLEASQAEPETSTDQAEPLLTEPGVGATEAHEDSEVTHVTFDADEVEGGTEALITGDGASHAQADAEGGDDEARATTVPLTSPGQAPAAQAAPAASSADAAQMHAPGVVRTSAVATKSGSGSVDAGPAIGPASAATDEAQVAMDADAQPNTRVPMAVSAKGDGDEPAAPGMQSSRSQAPGAPVAPIGDPGPSGKSPAVEAEARLAESAARSTGQAVEAAAPEATGAAKTPATSPPPLADATAIGGRVSVPVHVRFGSEAWAGQVAERAAQLTYHNIQSAQLQLDPPELGPLTVKIQVQQEQAVVHFVANNAQVKEALDGTMSKLRDLLADQGIELLEANVRDQTDQRGGRERKGFAAAAGFAGDQQRAEAVDDTPSVRTMTLSSGIDYFA